MDAEAAVAELNGRFHWGGFRSDLAGAGVILRHFDNTESGAQPWRGCGSLEEGELLSCLRWRKFSPPVLVRHGPKDASVDGSTLHDHHDDSVRLSTSWLSASIISAAFRAMHTAAAPIPLFGFAAGVNGCVSN